MKWWELFSLVFNIFTFICAILMWIFSYKGIKAILKEKKISKKITSGQIEEGIFQEKIKNDKILSEEGRLEYKDLSKNKNDFGKNIDATLTNFSKNTIESENN